MILRISLTKSTLEDYNYIDDKNNFPTKTALIKHLIKKEAMRLRVVHNEHDDYVPKNDFRSAMCHPNVKHYSKGLCRSCYLKKRYEKK